jgi:hypothetical protein
MGRRLECCRITLKEQINKISDTEWEFYVPADKFSQVASGKLLVSITRQLRISISAGDAIMLYDESASILAEGVVQSVLWFPTLDRIVADFGKPERL